MEPGRRAPSNPRHDPSRRDRIIDACLDVIAEHGLSGTSHRRVAAAAGVPLGSMTYHFSGMDELLREAFSRFASVVASRFKRRMSESASREDAMRAVVSIIADDVFSSERELVLTHELYTLAARDPSYRDLTSAWLAESQAALQRHFDPLTARLLDALIEGLTLHRALDNQPRDDGDIEAAVERIARPPSRAHAGPIARPQAGTSAPSL